MGACVYFLSQKYDINNFLIITPASTDIYQKTIRNFQIGNYDSVWADDTPFAYSGESGPAYRPKVGHVSGQKWATDQKPLGGGAGLNKV